MKAPRGGTPPSFSDAYQVDWTYAQAVINRRQFAEALADKVAQQYTVGDAPDIARQILFETLQELNGMRPGTFRAALRAGDHYHTWRFAQRHRCWEDRCCHIATLTIESSSGWKTMSQPRAEGTTPVPYKGGSGRSM